MSKTVTLETAKALKAALDAAGIEMPETDGNYIVNNKGTAIPICLLEYDQTIPAPDAEELGKWLPDEWTENDYKCFFEIGKTNHNYIASYAMNDGTMWINMTEEHESIAEALAALMIACLKSDPDQIKKHLAQ